MSKFISTLIFLIGTLTLAAQVNVLEVRGTVADENETPVPDLPVFISTIFSDSTFFFVDAFTNPDGQYEAVVEVPSGQPPFDYSWKVGTSTIESEMNKVVVRAPLNEGKLLLK